LPAESSGTVSDDDGAFELYPSDPEVSEDEDETDGIVGNNSLNVGGNSRIEDDTLNFSRSARCSCST
jgi:hypothetical protein